MGLLAKAKKHVHFRVLNTSPEVVGVTSVSRLTVCIRIEVCDHKFTVTSICY